ncbi:MAG: amino acid adenylation domain-containing protein [Richelia sp. RM1_1_1]|nr:amino acid adenylation domain-containing protein [Richelia sp. RM1_1_1]
MNDFSQRISELSPEKRKLLTQRLNQKKADSLSRLQIQSLSRESNYFALSFAQRRLWFLEQLHPGNIAYNISQALQLKGRLNVEALKQSFLEIVKRHEVFRTTFTTVDGQPVQVVSPAVNLILPVLDLTNLSTTQQQLRVQQLANEQAQYCFNIAQETLLKVKLLKLSETKHVLLFVMHHMISDAKSCAIIIEELTLLYKAFCSGKDATPSTLPSLPIQYVDYANWEQNSLQGTVLEEQLAYWKQQLADITPVLALPTDRSTSTAPSWKGAKASFQLPPHLSEKLKKLSQSEGSTLFMTLLAAFQVLLYRYSHQDDFCVGTAIDNRKNSQTNALIGIFINTLVLRANLAGNPSFRELLGRVKKIALAAYAHQDLPFEKLVEELQPERNLSHNPFFRVVFVLWNFPIPDLKLGDLNLSSLDICSTTSRFDLTLGVADTQQGLLGSFEYNTDLFDANTITRMIEHFQTLLESILIDPDQQISDLQILTEAERHQLLFEWNNTQTDYPQVQCLHQIFAKQVEKTPDAIALIFENEQVTYRELNARANQLARYLKLLGVRSEILVGICVERSVEMVVAILAILKAEGAYVSLDPSYPQERLSFIIQDAQIPVLLTQQQLTQLLPESLTRVVCLDMEWEVIAQQSSEDFDSENTVKNLAYVIYTSGSTGQPKGVLVKHENVTRLFDAVQSWFNFNQQDVWTLFHSIAFDFSVWEIWGALLYGGQLVIVPYWVTRTPETFYDLLCKHRVTVLNQTPSAFRQLIRVEESLVTNKDLALRLVIFGGEALELQNLKPWFARHSDQVPQLVNMYGITETTVHVTYRPLKLGDLHLGLGSVVGRPIPDLQVYLLDQHLQPVPIGVPGEIYIGGAGLVRGYLNRPDLTTEKFIHNPFSNKPGARLYRSGDLARYLSNGDLEYLGRIDHQVKIRGFRIELKEIETVLVQHQAVREAVVLVPEAEGSEKQLVAYVVTRNKQIPTASELRRFLKQHLPDYMVPSVFVMLDFIPLTVNGKVNLQALPIPNQNRPSLDEAFVAPRTPEEKILAEIWASVLGVEQVGIYDNFFTLGGDSICSIQVLSQAREKGVKFSLQEMFKYQTIHELLQNLTEKEVITHSVPPFSLISEQDKQLLSYDIEDAYPLTQLQMGMLFHSEHTPESAVYHDIFSFHLQVPLVLEVFSAVIEQLMLAHPILRTSFNLTSYSEPLQLVHKSFDIPLQLENIDNLSFDEQTKAVNAWIETEKSRHFDWLNSLLLRFHIHNRSAETFQFTLSFHHAILDGWSVASMLTELFMQYFSLINKEANTPKLPPVSTFKDFVALERQSIAADIQKRYWVEKLSNSSQTILPRLPNAYRRNSVSEIITHEVPLSPEVSESLLQLAQSLNVSLKTVLLAAHIRVLSLLSGQSDITTGLVSNGRPEDIDGERVLGLFLNTVPFRLQCQGGTWIELVRNTFETEQELIPYRRYPLAQIQQVLGKKYLFETAFNFVHFHVYQNLLNNQDIQILDIKGFEKTNFTFTAHFSQNPSSSKVDLCLKYDPTAFDEEQIQNIGHSYVRVLTAIANQPEALYEFNSLLSAQERHQLLEVWNNTQASYPIDKCIHELFTEQVEQTSDTTAVVFDEQRLTYKTLNARANQLAHYLQTLGVKPEVLVGICLERSTEMIVGLLGILKAGGAYIPLDPNHPQERLDLIFQDTKFSVLLTQQSLLNKFPQHQAQVICLDTDWAEIAQYNHNNPSSAVKTNNLAYVIYTSGSTGKPKGVQITHQNLVHSTWSRILYYSEPITNFLLISPFAFDSSVAGIFWTLCQGGVLSLPREGFHLELQQMVELIAQHQISHLLCLPSFYKLILEYAIKQKLVSLRTVIVAGEPCPTNLVESHKEMLPTTSLFNEYGPTEGTVWSSVYDCTNYTNQNIVPIGRPIANTQIYILDSYQQNLPVGVPGEIYIGGLGLAKGYLNYPELTAQKFILNPFCKKPMARLYKTGDLGRYLPDGNIEFLGRIDHQVKIRGFRIELEEIATVLLQNTDILQAVVLAKENNLNEKYLIAYIVIKLEKLLTRDELRGFLKDKLPEYMIPANFIFLAALPVTSNGKIDHQALLKLDSSSLSTEVNFVPPRNILELQLAQIWSEVLGIHPIGVKDNFFDKGGHSLLALCLMAKIQQQFGKKLPLATLLDEPTIEYQASLLQNHSYSQACSSLVAIQPLGNRTPFFCIHPIGGNVLCYAELARYLGLEQPFYGLQSLGLNEEEQPLTSIENMAFHYIRSMQSIQPQGPYQIGGWSLGGIIAFEMAQQLYQQGHEVALLALIDCYAPITNNMPKKIDEALLIASVAKDLGGVFGKYIPVLIDELQPLIFEDKVHYILDQVKKVNILPPEFGFQQMRQLLQVFQANLMATYEYIPKPYPGRITIFCSSEKILEVTKEPELGWGKLVTGDLETHEIPSNHYTILREPYVQVLATFMK